MKEYFKIHINNKKIKSNLQYIFPRKGEYKIKIEIKKLLNNMSDMFSDCSSLTSLNLSNFNTNNVEDMSSMFYNCSSLPSLNLSNFNTNNVEDMSYMFCGCSSLNSLNSTDKRLLKELKNLIIY